MNHLLPTVRIQNTVIYTLIIIGLITSIHGEQNPTGQDLSTVGSIAYISSAAGKDIIIIRNGQHEQTVFQCNDAKEMILTPDISYDRSNICFAIENGSGLRDIHVIKLARAGLDGWSVHDSVLISVNGGAWPHYNPNGDLYLSMKDPERLDFTATTNIYRVRGMNYIAINEINAENRPLWPLISPDGKQLHYRLISGGSGVEDPQKKQSIIYDFATQQSTSHFIAQDAFIEQWTANGKLLYSLRLDDEARTRVYYLYDIGTGESLELYRDVCWQARLSPDSNYITLLRNVPAGSAMFDIFVVNLETGAELNLTQTQLQSESMIGWLE